MTKLYELTQKYRDISNLLDADYAEQLNIKGTLDNIQEEFEQKAISIAKLSMEIKADEEAIDTEIERLKKKKTVLQNNQDSIKKYLLTEMTAVSLESIKDSIISIRIQKVQPSVDVVEETSIPEEYIRIIPEQKAPNKVEILKHFKGKLPMH